MSSDNMRFWQNGQPRTFHDNTNTGKFSRWLSGAPYILLQNNPPSPASGNNVMVILIQ